MLPPGDYHYEICERGELSAIEEARVDGARIVASRRSADGRSRHELEAMLDAEQRVKRVSIRYSSSLFARKASYEVVGEDFRGSVSALAGRNEIVVKLGRFREVEVADFLLFRALLIAHVRERGQARWTGRVAVIDPNTLVAASFKRNCFRRDETDLLWRYEPRMGEVEEIELDSAGRIRYQRDNRAITSRLIAAAE
ncbi:MAG: hypothetical protein JO307_28150 [Bryobacterales bacterium]|nr:hypothetical protein [Bryobacterales bacterium]